MVCLRVRCSVILAVLLGVLVATAGGTTLAATAHGEAASPAVLQDNQSANNSSTPPQQANPAQVEENGDTQALAARLQETLSERLGESSLQISDGEYEAAQGVLGDKYRETLSQYIEVAGETDEADAEQQREQFNETATTQSEYAQTLAEYEATYEEYQTARENGDDQTARRLARKLRTLAKEINRLGGSLTTNYQTLSNSTGASLENESKTVTNRMRNVTQQTQAVLSTEFISTALTATAADEGSFKSPVRITGRVATNGSTPLNGAIHVQTPDQRIKETVSENGSFTVRYRPTMAPTGQITANVTYVPAQNGTYLGSNTTVQTNVTQTTPSLAVHEQPSQVNTQRPIQVTGEVTAAGRGVPNMTVHLMIGRTPIGETQTNASGVYRFSADLPIAIPAGSKSLTVRTGSQNTALTPAAATSTVTVAETATNLSLSAIRNDESVTVQGRLRTANGAGINSQQIVLAHDGRIVEILETNASGHITTRIPLETVRSDQASIQLNASFDGQGTNLASADAMATASLPVASGLFGTGIPVTAGVLGVAGLFGIAALGYVVVRSRSPDGDSSGLGNDSRGEPPESPATGSDAEDRSGATRWNDRLAAARTALDDDDVERAVQTLYGALRATHTATSGTTRTHWEYFAAISDDLPSAARKTLRDVTEAYEAAQFADDPPPADEVASLIAASRTHFGDRTRNRNLNPTGHQTDE